MMKSPRPMGRMVIASSLRGFPSSRLRAILAGLPVARGYRLEVKPLRYRTSPHLAGECDYDEKAITLQVPEPFRAFRQRTPYRAQRFKALTTISTRSSAGRAPRRRRATALRCRTSAGVTGGGASCSPSA